MLMLATLCNGQNKRSMRPGEPLPTLCMRRRQCVRCHSGLVLRRKPAIAHFAPSSVIVIQGR
jgi:hypothetical protein